MFRSICVLLLLVLPATSSAQSNDALDKGEVFVTSEDVAGFDFPRLVVTAVIDAPPERVFQIVGDCDRFHARLPRIKASKTLKKAPDSHTCEVTVEVPFPMSDLTAVTVDRRKQGPDEWFRKWTLVQGVETSYEHLVGAFILKPFNGDPGRTLVRYEVHAIPKSSVPDFMRKTAQKKSLPGMIERIRKEVTKL